MCLTSLPGRFVGVRLGKIARKTSNNAAGFGARYWGVIAMKQFALLLFCSFVLLSCSKSKPIGADVRKNEKEESKGKASTVEITAEAQQRAGIIVTPAVSIPMTQLLRATGTVQPIDRSIGHVRPLGRGRLQEILVKVGDRVAAGQVLAQLDNIEAGEISAQYNSARAELQRLKIQLAAQQHQVERDRSLTEVGAVPEKRYEFSLAAQQGMQETIRAQESTIAGLNARLRRFGISDSEGNAPPTSAIRAPFAGVIIRMAAAPGDVVEVGTELFALADLSTVYVQAQVYEKDLGQVRVGQPAYIGVESYPGGRFKGRVASISDLIDPQTRTAAVRCKVGNSDARLKLEMLATVEFPTLATRATLSVPVDAIQTIEGKSLVFIRTSHTWFSIRPVETGVTSEGRTEIVRGLSDGEPVVSKGAFAVKSVLLGQELKEEKE
jgi:cobalt-zinc-cadmium efflux system membrane fusion protein